MKTLLGILVGLVLLSFVSCVEPNIGYPGKTNKMDSTSVDSTVDDSLKYPMDIKVEFSVIPLNVVLIDSCEYLYGPWGNGSVLTHKGNCKNKEHQENK